MKHGFCKRVPIRPNNTRLAFTSVLIQCILLFSFLFESSKSQTQEIRQGSESNQMNHWFFHASANTIGANGDGITKGFGFSPSISGQYNFGMFGLGLEGNYFTIKPDFKADEYTQYMKSFSKTTIDGDNWKSFSLLLGPHMNFYGKRWDASFSIYGGITWRRAPSFIVADTGLTPYTIASYKPPTDYGTTMFTIKPGGRFIYWPTCNVGIHASFWWQQLFGNADYTISYKDISNITISPIVNYRAQLARAVMITRRVSGPLSSYGIGLGVSIRLGCKDREVETTDYSKTSISTYSERGESRQVEHKPLQIRIISPAKIAKVKRTDKELPITWEAINKQYCGPLKYEVIIDKVNNIGEVGRQNIPEEIVRLSTQEESYIIKSDIIQRLFSASSLKDGRQQKQQTPAMFSVKIKATTLTGAEPACALGGNSTAGTMLMLTEGSNCDIEVNIISVECAEVQNSPGYSDYKVIFNVKNTSTNDCHGLDGIFIPATFSGYPSYPAGSNIKILDGNGSAISGATVTPANPLIGISLPSIGSSYTTAPFTLRVPSSTNDFLLQVHPTDPSNAILTYSDAYDTHNLPPCICKYCDDKIITATFGAGTFVPNIEYDELNLPVTLAYTPPTVGVTRIVAELVNFRHSFLQPNCTTCNSNDFAQGVFVDPYNNKILTSPTDWVNNGISNFYYYSPTTPHSREATWFNTAATGLPISGLQIQHRIGIPKLILPGCCCQIIHLTIRYSLFSKDETNQECRECEQIVSYCIYRGACNTNYEICPPVQYHDNEDDVH